MGHFFFFNDTATTEIYTLSLHDALPICHRARRLPRAARAHRPGPRGRARDRKSTRLNSSHGYISYAVFCLKKKITHLWYKPAVRIGNVTQPSFMDEATSHLCGARGARSG